MQTVYAASGVATSAWLLLALPALGALVLLVGGRRTDGWGHLLGCATIALAFVWGLVEFFHTTALPAAQRVQNLHLYTWIPVNDLQVDFGLRLDPLSLTFVLLITGVGGLIHIYSIGYMAADRDRRRFFGYLNLFVASMLLLVLGNGFVTLYLGWEGVGLASYLLIGWYSDRPSAATAAKKAFLMNRVGDVGLALAIFILFSKLHTTQFTEVFAQAHTLSGGTLTAVALLLLLGACGKSGQFPLQSWLPDAMEGPTPVSALIHAATMVTAGVYLVARANPIYDLTSSGRLLVVIIGTITLLIGSIIGCAYDDIKKVLAYSTVSQIGYMMLAVGLGPFGYALGIAHLLAHGFFKAGLFLGAGSVMHAMDDETDMRRFGGLFKRMPVTSITFGLGYLAIIGFPGLSGYFTKDAIIESAFGEPGWRGWVFGGAAALAAGITAFYMTRLVLMTFFGKERWRELKNTEGKDYHPHEASPVMTIPMIILAIGS
ncbi:MAG TPA: NADH-quinone oxidoreductase subunit L, partial [Pseudonocardiaceae bacterium]